MENYNTKNQSKMKIYIRPELFDHLIYPLTAKLDDNLILLLFRKLHVSSEIDFKIPLKSWVTKAKEIWFIRNRSKYFISNIQSI